MKKIILLVDMILFSLLITSCNPEDAGDISANTNQQIEEAENQHIESQETKEAENQHIESQETKEADSLSWFEITEDGVDEELFLENLDTEVLE